MGWGLEALVACHQSSESACPGGSLQAILSRPSTMHTSLHSNVIASAAKVTYNITHLEQLQ